jgi:hypothetical protein
MRWQPTLALPLTLTITLIHEVAEGLGLHNLMRADRYFTWHIEPSCATTGAGLYEGLDWLSDALQAIEKGVPRRVMSGLLPSVWDIDAHAQYGSHLRHGVIAAALAVTAARFKGRMVPFDAHHPLFGLLVISMAEHEHARVQKGEPEPAEPDEPWHLVASPSRCFASAERFWRGTRLGVDTGAIY